MLGETAEGVGMRHHREIAGRHDAFLGQPHHEVTVGVAIAQPFDVNLARAAFQHQGVGHGQGRGLQFDA
ncbi:hypothetical protein D3C83_299560 [compost metagenome]